MINVVQQLLQKNYNPIVATYVSQVFSLIKVRQEVWGLMGRLERIRQGRNMIKLN